MAASLVATMITGGLRFGIAVRVVLLSSDFCILPPHSPTSKLYFCLYDLRKSIVTHVETKLPADLLHAVVVGKHLPDDMFNSFLAADFQKKLQEVSPESMPLPLIADHDCKFSVIDAVHLD
jgi:hypothetical protein